MISQWMNHSGPASERNSFTHDRSTLHCDGWVGTSRIKKKKKDQIAISTCSVASCGAVQYAPPVQWPLSWNLWDFYPQPAVAFTGNKAMNSVFLPTPTPHGITYRLHIVSFYMYRVCVEPFRYIHTTFKSDYSLTPDPQCMSQKLYALYDHFLILLELD